MRAISDQLSELIISKPGTRPKGGSPQDNFEMFIPYALCPMLYAFLKSAIRMPHSQIWDRILSATAGLKAILSEHCCVFIDHGGSHICPVKSEHCGANRIG
jgi:hypothetical protein